MKFKVWTALITGHHFHMQERWLERDAEFMRSTPMRAADTRKSGSKIEITVNATGRQSMSPPASPDKQDKVSPELSAADHAGYGMQLGSSWRRQFCFCSARLHCYQQS